MESWPHTIATLGGVTKAPSSTNNAIAVFDGITGGLLKNTALLLTAAVGYVALSVGTANASLALVPNGTGALQAAIADGTAVGGNARGLNAVDWQTARALNTQVASGINAVVGGGQSNRASGQWSTIAGGNLNIANSQESTVGGGTSNGATAGGATVSGGNGNGASGTFATVGGGQSNIASTTHATVGGGSQNTASHSFAVVSGGLLNIARGYSSNVSGGAENEATTNHAHVPGGWAALADHFGEHAWSSGKLVTRGDCQRGDFGFSIRTIDATPAILTANGEGDAPPVGGITRRFFVSANNSYAFTVIAMASQTGGLSGARGDTRWFTITGAAKNVGGTMALVGTPVVHASGDAAAAAWGLVASVNTGDGNVRLTFTGENQKNINVGARIDYQKLGF